MELVTIDDIRAAAEILTGVVVHTPLLPQPWSQPGRQLWLKPENLQPVGAFKLRGAYHAIAVLPDEARKAGVVTHSSGNHGRAVAYAAALFGVPAVVVIPDVAPPIKIEAVRELGAEVVLVPGSERADATERIAAERGMAVIPPFDHRDVIAGQGTVGLELLEQVEEVGVVVVPVGGGGLIAGAAVAIKKRRPDVRVVAVEPALAADLAEGFTNGKWTVWSRELTGRTIADGLRSAAVGELTWRHIEALVDEVVTVSEESIVSAMRWLAESAKLVVEPSGAVAAAAMLEHPSRLGRGTAVVIATGGNIDIHSFAALTGGQPSMKCRSRPLNSSLH